MLRSNQPLPFTTHPADDYQSAVSQDGELIVFVSTRSGQKDLWYKSIHNGTAEQLTFHSSDDYEPDIDKTGKRVVFVSRRDNALGNIYIRYFGGAILKLNSGKGEVHSPKFTADGRNIIYTRTRVDAEITDIYRLGLAKNEEPEKIWENGISPDISPDGSWIVFAGKTETGAGLLLLNPQNGFSTELTDGINIDAFPAFGFDNQIYFYRYSDDTNGDHKINLEDYPHLVKIDLNTMKESKLTIPEHFDYYPAISQEKIYFTRQKAETSDILAMNLDGLIPKMADAGKQLKLALSIKDTKLKALALEKVSEFPGSTNEASQALMTLGQLEADNNNYLAAWQAFQRVQTEYSSLKKLAATAHIYQLRINQKISASGEQLFARLDSLKTEYSDFPDILAEMVILKADALLTLGYLNQALSAYQSVPVLYSHENQQVAQAIYKMGLVQSELNFISESQKSYLEVITNYSSAVTWVEKALQELIAGIGTVPNREKRLSLYRGILKKYPQSKELFARITTLIASEFKADKDWDLALSEYSKIITSLPPEHELYFQAAYQSGVILENINDNESAVKFYQRLFDFPNAEKKNQARQQAADLYFKQGFEAIELDDFSLAANYFEKALDLFPASAKAYRQIVRCYAKRDKLNQLIKLIKNNLTVNKKSATLHYALGLSFTYKGEEFYSFAIKELTKALELDNRLLYAYLARGWIYEQKLIAERKQKDSVNETFYQAFLDNYGLARAINDQKTNPSLEADINLALGNISYFREEFKWASFYYQLRSELPIHKPDLNTEALFYRNYGRSLSMLNLNKQALAAYKKAAAIYKSQTLWAKYVQILALEAFTQENGLNYIAAINLYQEILTLRKEKGLAIPGHIINLNIGRNYFLLGEEKEAELYLKEALSQLEQVKEAGATQEGLLSFSVQVGLDGEQSSATQGFNIDKERKLIYSYLTKIYLNRQNYANSASILNKQLSALSYTADLKEQAIILNNLGFIYYLTNQLESANEKFLDSLTKIRRHDPYGKLLSFLNLTRIAVDQSYLEFTQKSFPAPQNFHQAIKYGEKSLGVIKDLGYENNFGYADNLLGILFYLRGYSFRRISLESRELTDIIKWQDASLRDYYRAERHWRSGIGKLEKEKNFKGAAALHYNLIHLQLALGEEKEASTELKQLLRASQDSGDRLLEWRLLKLKAELAFQANPKLAEKLFLTALDIMENSYFLSDQEGMRIDIDAEELYLKLIDYYIEQNQHQHALEILERKRQLSLIRLTANKNLSFKSELDNITARDIEYHQQQITHLLYPVEEKDKQKREEVWREYLVLKENTIVESPDLAALYWITPFSTSQIQIELNEKTALLNYQVTEAGLNIWLISSDKIDYYYQKVKPAELNNKISEFLASIETGNNDQESGKVLGALLIEPLAQMLANYSRIHLVNNQIISRIPFTALPYGDGYLIDQIEIVSNFSLKQWLTSFQKRNLNYTSHLILDLPEAVDETSRLNNDRFLTSTAKLFLNQNQHLNKEPQNLLDKISSYGVVSWFDPIDFNQINPWESGIETQNGLLAFDQLFQKQLDSALLVLPNQNLTSENEMSQQLFVQALLYSGCPQTVISGWPAATAIQLELLSQYYSHLKNKPEAQALRETILDFKSNHPDPLDWAGLRLYGYGGLTTQEQTVLQEEIYSDTLKQALKAFAKKKWEVALNLFELAASMAKNIAEVKETDLDKIYSAIIIAGINNASFAKAADYQEIFVERAKSGQDSEVIYEALQKLLYLRSEARQFTQAADSGETLIEHLQTVQDAQSSKRLAETYNNLAKMYQIKRDFPTSLELFQKSITLCQEQHLTELLARNYFERANFKTVDLDNYEGAFADYSKALEIYTSLKMYDKMIQVEQGVGRTLLKSGKFQQALNKAQAAAKIAEKHKRDNLYAESLVDQANAYWKLGDIQKARELTLKTLEQSQFRADFKLELTARTLLGLIYRYENHLAEALTEQEKVVNLAKQINDQMDLATAYNNLGLTYQKNNQLTEAFDTFKLALAIDEELNSVWGQMYDYRNLGLNSFKRGEIDAAINYQKVALKYARQLKNDPEQILILLQLGNFNAKQNEREAVEYYQQAAKLAKTSGSSEFSWRALFNLGLISENQGQEREAYSLYREALKILSQIAPSNRGSSRSYELSETPALLYEKTIALGWRLKEATLSFQYSEQAKAAAFLNLIATQDINFENEETSETWEKYLKLWRQVGSLNSQLSSDEIQNEIISQQLSKIKEHKNAILDDWQKTSPNLYYLVASDRIEVSALQNRLTADEAIVAYFITEKELYSWLLTKTGLNMYSVNIEKAKLLDLIANYRTQIQKTADYRQLSRSLYQTLLAPLDKELVKISKIYFVPHLNLHYLPFASLRDGQIFLIEKFQLIQLPQANLLAYCQSLSKPGIKNILAFGNPKTDRENYQLPFSEKEVKSIARSFSQTTGLVNEKATESTFKSLASQYQAIHFGSHGELAPQNPLFSTLELAPDENNDGHLRVREILGMELAAQLVTLSACQTGLGNKYQGEEISGLNRAFLFAGTPSVVSTLWRINDVTAAVLTKRFYRYLLNHDKAAALQKAQLLVKKYYPHPVYWAAFTLTGAP